MQLTELAALLNLAAVETDKKAQGLENALRTAGLTEDFGDNVLFELCLQQKSYSHAQTVQLLGCLNPQLNPGEGLETNFERVANALAYGVEDVPSDRLSLFLCFIVARPHAEMLTQAASIITRKQVPAMGFLTKENLLNGIPQLIAVSYAAYAFTNPGWTPSRRSGSLSFSTAESLLRGVASTTFEEFVDEGCQLRVENLYAFLEASAKNLSDLMLHQTLLEQEAFRTSTHAPEHRESMHHTMSQSKRLFEKYLSNPTDVERVMREVWRDSVTNFFDSDVGESSRQEVESLDATSTVGVTASSQLDSECDIHQTSIPVRTPVPECNSHNALPQPVTCHHDTTHQQGIQNQNDLLQGLVQIAGDLGQRLVLVTVGRFLLFLALLYGSGALGFVLFKEAGFSIALSLLCTFAFTLSLAAIAFFLSKRGCAQLGEEASRNLGGVLQTNTASSAVNGLLRDSMAPGLQPMVKTVVDSLVPQQSRCSLVPVQVDMARPRIEDIRGQPAMQNQRLSEIRRSQQLSNVPQTSSADAADTSMASKLRGIMSTVGKIAAHFHGKSGHGESYPEDPTDTVRPMPTSSSLEVSALDAQSSTAHSTLLSAYPHLRNGSS